MRDTHFSESCSSAGSQGEVAHGPFPLVTEPDLKTLWPFIRGW